MSVHDPAFVDLMRVITAATTGLPGPLYSVRKRIAEAVLDAGYERRAPTELEPADWEKIIILQAENDWLKTRLDGEPS